MSVVSTAIVKDIIVYSDSVREYLLDVEEYDSYEPGQFLQLTLDKVDASGNWPESRTFSIASYSTDDKTIRIIIKKAGNYTEKIFSEFSIGTECTIKYAYGDFMLPMFDEEEAIHCIAGGTGIAPFLCFMEYLKNEGQIDRLYIYYSIRKETEMAHYEDMLHILPKGHLSVFCTREKTDRGSNRRMELNDVVQNVKNIQEEHFYICGSSELIKKFKVDLESQGADNIYLDEWD
ncbi:MAG: FAD-dependent oxidoreductase [Reichenbachiella sp.]